MTRIAFVRLALFATLSTLLPAQEGHPLVGTWRGMWKAGNTQKEVVLYLEWDGKNLSGMVNPGPDSIKLTKAELVPDGWMVKLEGQGLMVDAKVSNITNLRRTITGTWKQGNQSGPVTLQLAL